MDTETVRYLAAIVATFAIASIGFSQDSFPDVPDDYYKPFPDIPENHWAFEPLKAMKSVSADFMPTRRTTNPETRYFMAEMTRRAISLLPAIAEDMGKYLNGEKLPSSGHNVRTKSEAIETCQRLVDQEKGFHRLITTFSNDLKMRGNDLAAMSSSLDGSMAKLHAILIDPRFKGFVPFKDVPRCHWASDATLELRQAGILVGYPDERFHG